MKLVTDTYWQDVAIEKTTKELSAVKGQKENIMAKPVLKAIHDFCIQNQCFARAVAEGGTFADCMTAVAKGCGNSISDIAAFRKAVQFYFPDAEIEAQMQIFLPEADGHDNSTAPVISLNILDLL